MRCNLFILLLISVLFMSCKFFGNNNSGKKSDASNISKLETDTSSSKQDENTSDTTSEAKKHESSLDILADAPSDSASAAFSIDKQENKGKFTKEDNKNLYT
ncbi:hypothetical protein F0310_05445, partial (plasmid) [Borrelia sp. A-FGy1]